MRSMPAKVNIMRFIVYESYIHEFTTQKGSQAANLLYSSAEVNRTSGA